MQRLASRSFLTMTVLVSVFSAGKACAEGWSEDVPATLKEAQAAGQDVLMDFTGSDWCHWCQRLDKEVFEEEAFRKGAAAHWRLAKLDFPQQRKLSDQVKAQNEEWQRKFGVAGYPTVMLVDAKGRPFGRMGYQEGGPGAFLKGMEEARARRVARDAKWAEAAKATGAARAKLLDEGLQALGDEKLVLAHYKPELVEAMKLDAGIKARYEAKLKQEQAEKRFATEVPAILETAEKQPEEAVGKLRVLADDKEMPAEIRQKSLFLISQVYRLEVKDMARAEKAFDEAIAIAPDSEFGTQLQVHKAKVYPKK